MKTIQKLSLLILVALLIHGVDTMAQTPTENTDVTITKSHAPTYGTEIKDDARARKRAAKKTKQKARETATPQQLQIRTQTERRVHEAARESALHTGGLYLERS